MPLNAEKNRKIVCGDKILAHNRRRLDNYASMRLFIFLFLCPFLAFAEPLHFAWLSDTHVGSPTGRLILRATIKDINSQSNLQFVIVSGDLTELGKDEEFELAKSIYDECKIPRLLTPGKSRLQVVGVRCDIIFEILELRTSSCLMPVVTRFLRCMKGQ